MSGIVALVLKVLLLVVPPVLFIVSGGNWFKSHFEHHRPFRWVLGGIVVVSTMFLLRDLFEVSIKRLGSDGDTIGESAPLAPGQAGDVVASCEYCPTMVRIPGGTFVMGSNEGHDNEKPVHTVTVQAFDMGETEVTFDQYDAFATATGHELPNARIWGRGDRPVIYVSWNDAVAYAQWLSKQTGDRYRLPTESEWEYAARAGTTTPFYTGECISTRQANYDGNYDYVGCGTKTGEFLGQTAPVKTYEPNSFGLFDMAGNVFEWVEDCWHENYNGAPTDGSAWRESHNGKCDRRVLRGGGWIDTPEILRAAYRVSATAGNAYFSSGGFRLARTP